MLEEICDIIHSSELTYIYIINYSKIDSMSPELGLADYTMMTSTLQS